MWNSLRGLWRPALALPVLIAIGWIFWTATTFHGDDYIFRAYGQLEPHPFAAFFADKHGGEYYRPIPMALWWVFERLAGGRTWPFALLALTLHALCALSLARLAGRLGAAARTQWGTGLLFFCSAAQVEAALWYSASTDLLATLGILLALRLALSPGRLAFALALAAAAMALLSKETALCLAPLIVLTKRWFDPRVAGSWGRAALASVLFFLLSSAYLVARFAVLGGEGGAGDPSAIPYAQSVQVLAGLLRVFGGYGPWSTEGSLVLGAGMVLTMAWLTRREGAVATWAWLFVLLASLLLPFAGWVVGARYFYLPAAGLILLLGRAMRGRPAWMMVALVGLFAGQSLAVGVARGREVRRYERTVAAAQAAVVASRAAGHRLFLFRGAVKDLDVALKLDRRIGPAIREVLAIPDVPASFAWMPPDLRTRAGFLLADPPLPPSGAYRFTGGELVGLARREESPTLDEVLDKLPELRFIRLVEEANHEVRWTDFTEAMQRP
jgi:hypothetical protein